MKIITEPRVTVVGVTKFIEHPEYKVPPDGTDMERLGAFAAKGCYDSYGETGRGCVENQREVIGHRHGSVSEHMHVSLFIEGITRALSLELNRHRPFNISQRSTRYTKEEDASIVLDPYFAYLKDIYEKGLCNNSEYALLAGHIEASGNAITEYEFQVRDLINLNPFNLEGFNLRKWARGKARNLLPHNLETRGTWTSNIRALRHFIELRSAFDAEEEIRRLAFHVYEAVKDLAPVYFEDYKVVYKDIELEGYPNYPALITDNRKI